VNADVLNQLITKGLSWQSAGELLVKIRASINMLMPWSGLTSLLRMLNKYRRMRVRCRLLWVNHYRSAVMSIVKTKF